MKKFFYALLGFLAGSWLVDQFVNYKPGFADRNNDPWKPATDCSPEDVPIVTVAPQWIMNYHGTWTNRERGKHGSD